ncbi:hypothetical protein PR048_028692 [Dryococelus australis]|uniref:Uncharacterized protein n=1 Tax=Dryococelus australis TaxID=614101 RepID=A0ABQ9GDY4_9NEOP|nr:hypothetical protein PR048_028692 [Dryococelus australis]
MKIATMIVRAHIATRCIHKIGRVKIGFSVERVAFGVTFKDFLGHWRKDESADAEGSNDTTEEDNVLVNDVGLAETVELVKGSSMG